MVEEAQVKKRQR